MSTVHVTPVRTYLLVFAGLMVLTVLTVGLAHVNIAHHLPGQFTDAINDAVAMAIAVTKATKAPTVVLSLPPCQFDVTATTESATEAINCVIGEVVAAAVADLIIRRRSHWLWRAKRSRSARAAPCRRTMRQASTFSSTT